MSINDFKDSFGSIKDSRQEWKVKHSLIKILYIGVIATVANANTWIEIGTFAEIKKEWLKNIYPLKTECSLMILFKEILKTLIPKPLTRRLWIGQTN